MEALTTAEQPGTVAVTPPSTVLNPNTISGTSGGGKPDINEPEGQSLEDILTAESKRLRDEDQAAEKEVRKKADKAVDDAKVKADDAAKAERQPKAEKPVKNDAVDGENPEPVEKSAAQKPATGQDGQERRQSEGQHREPPARFLPEARTKWANVPNEVKAEFHRVSQEMETEITRHKEASDRYEQFRRFDDMAKANGRDFATESIPKVLEFERMIQRNPIAALDFALKETGSQYSLYDVAQAIVQRGPQAVQQAFSHGQGQPAQLQPNHEIEALKAEIQAMRVETTVKPVVAEFQRSHPDLDARSVQMEAILKSGVIDQIYGSGLSLEQKLAEAYRMAGGVPPSRSEPHDLPAHSEPPARPVDPDAGKKSVRGAPVDGADTPVSDTETDLDQIFRKEMRKLAR